MSQQNWMQRTGATPGKLALVGVLAVVLVVVIVGQFSDSPDSPEIARKRPTPQREKSKRLPITNLQRALQNSAKSNSSNPASTETLKDLADRAWPEFSLESILDFDPLATPDWLVAAQNATPPVDSSEQLLTASQRQERNAQVLAKLRDQGTKAIVISAGEKRALLGERPVHIGDNIEGFKITDITKQGIVLTEIK